MSLSEIKDLRKTNFVIGGNSNKEDLTVYYRDYRPWEIGHDLSAQKYKFQKTNITGDNTSSKNWASTNTKDFVKHEHVEPSHLNEDRKHELRSHQFNFGTDKLLFQVIGEAPK